MKATRRALLLLPLAIAALAAPSGAVADVADPTGFHLDSPALVVHEHDGQAVINVTRTDASAPGQIRFGEVGITAIKGADYTPAGGRLDFAAGQTTGSFSIPIVDHGIPGPPKTISVYIYGPYPIGLGVPAKAVLTVINDDAVNVARIATNPLGLPSAPPSSDPLAGASFYVDHVWGLAARAEQALRASGDSGDASLLDVIASQPETQRFGPWDGPDPSNNVSQFLQRASLEEPGTVPMIATYYLVGNQCGGYSDSPAQVAAWEHWVDGFVGAISTYRAVLFLEMDSLITRQCLSTHGLNVRMGELRYALDRLSKLPRLVTYLDAGAADSQPASVMATLLKRAGVSEIQGFFLNSTHYDWTSKEIAYGEQISRMTGGKHFVVNTAVNGRGPKIPKNRVRDGNEDRCDPPGRGLGPKPTANTGFPNVDAFAWIGNPGRSTGPCGHGGPPVGVFWVTYAVALVKNAVFTVH